MQYFLSGTFLDPCSARGPQNGAYTRWKIFFQCEIVDCFVTLNFWRNTAQILKTCSHLYRPIVNLEEDLASKGSNILFSAEGWE